VSFCRPTGEVFAETYREKGLEIGSRKDAYCIGVRRAVSGQHLFLESGELITLRRVREVALSRLVLALKKKCQANCKKGSLIVPQHLRRGEYVMGLQLPFL